MYIYMCVCRACLVTNQHTSTRKLKGELPNRSLNWEHKHPSLFHTKNNQLSVGSEFDPAPAVTCFGRRWNNKAVVLPPQDNCLFECFWWRLLSMN